MTSERIPVIDIAPFREGGEAARAVTDAVRSACEGIGFLVITGHGMPADAVDTLMREARSFFDAPIESKTRIARHGTTFGGPSYTPMNAESLGALDGVAGRSDLKEVIDVAPRHHGDHWPEGTEHLAAAWTRAAAACDELAATMRAIFATAMGLPADALEASFDRHASSMRALNYPEVPGFVAEGQERAGMHTDYSAFTMIRGDEAPGLEARALCGEWIVIPVVPDSFVINIGDALMRWTNDKWRSTPHRVVAQAGGRVSPRRQSLAFFHNPNGDAVIECLSPFRPVDGEPRYPPITYQAYSEGRFREQVGDATLRVEIDVR